MKIIFYIRTNTGCPVFLTACCYLVIGNPAVIIMRLKYNVHSLIYSKPIFEEKREPENKKIFLFVLFIGNPLSETWFLRVSWLQQFFSSLLFQKYETYMQSHYI